MKPERPLLDSSTYFGKLRLFTRNATVVLAYSALTGLTYGVFRLLFNFYVLSLGGYDERFLGLLTSISSAASLAAALPAAYIAGRFSHRRIMMITGVLSAFTFLGLVLLPYRSFLILFMILAGVAMTMMQVTIAPFLMLNTSREERQYVFSFNFGLVTISGFVGNLVGGLLPGWLGRLVNTAPTDTLSYQLALGSMVVIGLLAVLPLIFIRPGLSANSRATEMPWTLLRRHGKQLAKLLLPNWLIGLGAGMFMPFMNIYYRNVFGQSDAIIGYLFATGALAMGLAQFIAPPLADRVGKVNTAVWTQAISIPFLLALGFSAWIVPRGGNLMAWFAVAWIAYLVRLALMNLSGPVYQTFILEQVPENTQALATSLNNIAFQFGWVLSPQLSGWLQINYGFVPVFIVTSALYVVGIGLVWAFFHDAERKMAAQEQATTG